MELTKPKFKKTEIGLIPEDWIVKSLGQLVKLKNGFAFSSDNYSNKGPILITPGNFKIIGGLNFNSKNTIRFSGEFSSSMILKKGDLVLVMTDLTPDCNLLGKSGIINQDEVILHNQRIGKIEIQEQSITRDFLNIYFNSSFFSNWMKSTATGSTVRHTSVPTIKASRIVLPTLPEQKAIATALNDVDELIASLEKLIEKKKAIKQGVMQRLLTPPHKGGERLEGFSGEWVEYELNEILTFGSGTDYKHLPKGEVPVYGTGGIMTYVNGYLFEGDSVGIGRKGTIDQPILLTGKFWTVDTLFYTHSFKNCTPLYIYYLFLGVNWKAYNEASGVPSLSKHTLGKIKVVIPKSTKEQEAIAKLISIFEREISQLEFKRNKILNLKLGTMQELLTGRARLV